MSMLSQYHREQNENIFKPYGDTIVTARKTHSFGPVESPEEASTRKLAEEAATRKVVEFPAFAN